MARFETFGELKAAVAYAIGANSVADLGPAREQHLERIINNSVRHIHERLQYKHLQVRRIFRTFDIAEATSGVTISSGATSATLPAGVAKSTMVGSSILFGSQETPYRINNVSGNDVGLYQPYVGPDLTDAAYKVVNSHLIMPEDYDVLIKVHNLTEDDHIDYVEYSLLLEKVANPFSRSWSRPRFCAIDGRIEQADTGGLVSPYTYRPWLMLLYPIPDTAYDIQVDYTRMVKEMSVTDDEPDLPPQHRQTIYEMAVAYFSSPDSAQVMASMGIDALQKKPSQNPRRRQLGSAWSGGRRFPEDKITPDNGTIWPGGVHV